MSDEAVLVLAKTIPIDILAYEMRRIYFRRLKCPEQLETIKANGSHGCPLYNSLDGGLILRTVLLCKLVFKWPWVLQEVTADGCDISSCCHRLGWPGDTSLALNWSMEDMLNNTI